MESILDFPRTIRVRLRQFLANNNNNNVQTNPGRKDADGL